MSGVELRKGVAAALLLLGMSGPVLADPLADGYTAFQQKDYKTALKYWLPLAEGGDSQAQFYLNEIYTNGLGVKVDPERASHWLEQSAKNGFPPAQFNMGNNFHGKGVYDAAVTWWSAAAEQGFVQAQYNLGVAYLQGSGVKQDRGQAVYWFRKAARSGSDSAKETLKQLNVPLDPMPESQQAGGPAAAGPGGGAAKAGAGVGGGDGANTEWVAAQPPGNHTLQAFGSNDRGAALDMAQRLTGLGYPVAVISYRRDAGTLYAVVVGSFPTAAEAAKVKQKLPDALLKGNPWTRSFASIHKLR